jgi:hypothetical protein
VATDGNRHWRHHHALSAVIGEMAGTWDRVTDFPGFMLF